MCSLSVIRPAPATLRVVMNRDELDERPASFAPRAVTLASGVALCTVDSLAGGAWLGVNDAGLVVGLLNRTVAGDQVPAKPSRSRGQVVPAALAATSADAALLLVAGLATSGMAPFTLVACDAQATRIVAWTGRDLLNLPADVVRCSSGLGDARVDAARRQAWAELTTPQITAAQQDAWHCNRGGDDGAAWVLMRRPGARTVSRTIVTVGGAGIALDEVLLDAAGVGGRRTRVASARP